MRHVLICDRCGGLLKADRIAPLCPACHSFTDQWPKPDTPAIQAAATQARRTKPTHRPIPRKTKWKRRTHV